jgi:hypothetical protein
MLSNVADIRSFHGTQWSENLGEHLALAKREPDIVLLADVFLFPFGGEFTLPQTLNLHLDR